MKGKLIIVEGTDCSGKETQANLLKQYLNKIGKATQKISFPKYDTPTGRIVGSCFLGKEELCHNHLRIDTGWFEEGASAVDPFVSSLYYAADRKYNINEINDLLATGTNVILDRYTYSNMAHQGCKFKTPTERLEFFKKIETLEFSLLGLPKPDIVLFLYVPHEVCCKLKKIRNEAMDQNEKDEEYLKKTEATYLELADLYNFSVIKCTSHNKIKSREEITNDIIATISSIV